MIKYFLFTLYILYFNIFLLETSDLQCIEWSGIYNIGDRYVQEGNKPCIICNCTDDWVNPCEKIKDCTKLRCEKNHWYEVKCCKALRCQRLLRKLNTTLNIDHKKNLNIIIILCIIGSLPLFSVLAMFIYLYKNKVRYISKRKPRSKLSTKVLYSKLDRKLP